MARGKDVLNKKYKEHPSSVKLPRLKEARSRREQNVNSVVTLLNKALEEGRSYPHTTAGEIGWKSADFSKLERFGRHARGQQGIRHLLDWPREAVY